MKIKKFKINLKIGNVVQVITGIDKGKNGKILALFPTKNRALVQGINIKFRHVKATNPSEKGEIKEIELPIHCSNLKLID